MVRMRTVCLAVVLVFGGLWLPSTDAHAAIESAPSALREHGARVDSEGWIHFGLHAPDAGLVSLLLFDVADATAPVHIIPMQQHNGDWHIKIRGPEIGPGLAYMYRAEGPRDLSPDDRFGRMFNDNHVLGAMKDDTTITPLHQRPVRELWLKMGDVVWAKTKAGVQAVGARSFAFVWDMAKAIVRTEIRERTGLDV